MAFGTFKRPPSHDTFGYSDRLFGWFGCRHHQISHSFHPRFLLLHPHPRESFRLDVFCLACDRYLIDNHRDTIYHQARGRTRNPGTFICAFAKQRHSEALHHLRLHYHQRADGRLRRFCRIGRSFGLDRRLHRL